MKTYLVDRKGDLGRNLAVYPQATYEKSAASLPNWFPQNNPIIGEGRFLKGRSVSKFNGRSVRLFECDGKVYEVFSDGSARLRS